MYDFLKSAQRQSNFKVIFSFLSLLENAKLLSIYYEKIAACQLPAVHAIKVSFRNSLCVFLGELVLRASIFQIEVLLVALGILTSDTSVKRKPATLINSTAK